MELLQVIAKKANLVLHDMSRERDNVRPAHGGKGRLKSTIAEGI
jgi:hypothetical protein